MGEIKKEIENNTQLQHKVNNIEMGAIKQQMKQLQKYKIK